MDLVLMAVKTDLNNCLNTGQYMLVSLFLLAIVVNFMGLLHNSISWSQVILRLAIGFILLQNYVWIMDTTRNIVIGVDEMINPNQDTISQFSNMSKTMQQKHEDTTRQSILSQVTNAVVSFGRYTVRNFIINVSFVFYAAISNVMESVRYSMVAILYKLGPVLIPFVLFRSTGNVVKGWFTNYVAVLCWPILWHIALGIAVSYGNQLMVTGGVEQFACLNLALCFVLVFSPLIINSFVSGVGMGSSSALAGIMSSRTATNFMTAMGVAGVALGASKVAQPLIQKYLSINSTPTTSAGKFKDTMLGSDKDKGEKKP